jgi:signal transduction histidine kinase
MASPALLRGNEAPPRRATRLASTPVFVGFAAIALGFLASTVYSEVRASAIDHEASQIEQNALPSVEALAAARAALRHLEVASDQYADASGDARERAATAMHAARDEVSRQLSLELATDVYPGEPALAAATTLAMNDLDVLIDRLRELATHDDTQAAVFAEQELRAGVERADAALGALMALNAQQGYSAVTRIAAIRAVSLRYAFLLTLGSVSFAVIAALFALRTLRRQREIERVHATLLEERAGELEVFASRVAHDLLGPLAALSFTLSSLKRNAARGLPLTEPLARADACLKRSRLLVEGVLDFARSGGAPASGESANVRTTLEGVLDEIRADDDGTELMVEDFDGEARVTCPEPILASVLSNLLRNAVKYTAEQSERRVTARVFPRSSTVRIEVEDTGPGLPPGLESRLFQPYVRGPDNPRPGLGLGLATVRRFVEAYGGRVGVRSDPDHGCLFWFELPGRAGSESVHDVDAPADTHDTPSSV